MDWMADHGWALWGVGAATLIVWLRLVRRGGDEPLLRRILFVANPRTDPRHRRHDPRLPLRLMLLAIGGVALALLILALLELFQ